MQRESKGGKSHDTDMQTEARMGKNRPAEKDFETIEREFFEDTGTIADGRWEALRGDMPTNEREPCWWLALNADESQPARLLYRDLASLILELRKYRVATPTRANRHARQHTR